MTHLAGIVTHLAAALTQSAVRGVSNAGTPGLAYTMLLKLFLMCLTRPQIKSMLGKRLLN